MTREDKELLLKDLCTRLPYGIVLNVGDTDIKLDRKHQGIGILYPEDCSDEFNKNHNEDFYIVISGCYYGNDIKPYLRPLSSITEEEKEEIKPLFSKFTDESGKRVLVVRQNKMALYQDWLNAHHFDYRDLIPKGLAIEAPKDMYKLK